MEDKWLAYNNTDIDFVPFKRNPKAKEVTDLIKCSTNLQTMKNLGGMKNDVNFLCRLPLMSSKIGQQLLIGVASRQNSLQNIYGIFLWDVADGNRVLIYPSNNIVSPLSLTCAEGVIEVSFIEDIVDGITGENQIRLESGELKSDKSRVQRFLRKLAITGILE